MFVLHNWANGSGCISTNASYLFVKVMPPKGATQFVYYNISFHKTGLIYPNNLVKIPEKNRKNRSFSGKIGINKNRSEK